MTTSSPDIDSGKDTIASVVDAVVLAGSRPGGDALADDRGVPVKALVPVAGKAMLAHVSRTLLANKRISRLYIMAQDALVFGQDRHTAGLASEPRVTMWKSEATIASSMEAFIVRDDMQFPLLITAADNVLLDNAMITHFLEEASGSDVAVAVVEHDVLMEKYPASQRTWLKLRGGQYSGANLFYLGSPSAGKILQYWAEVEQDRKKGWKILTIFGPWLLFLALTRMLSIDGIARRVGKKLGLGVKIVQMPQAEACIDVDKEKDLLLTEQILAARRQDAA